MTNMARPLKEGLEYFPLDVDCDQDDKLIVPVAKFGMQGYGIIVKLMSEIYRNGYCYHWGELEQYVFSSRINVDINLINDVINECIKWNFFNNIVFNDHKVLTSRGFQKRYLEATKRRKEINIINDYVLADLKEISERLKININCVNVNGNRVIAYIYDSKSNSTSTITTQSKEKEKEKEKVKEIENTLLKDSGGGWVNINIFRLFESEGFGTISSTVKDSLCDFEDTYGNRWTVEALKESVLQGKRSLSYVNGILKRWRAEGIDTPWAVEKPPSKDASLPESMRESDTTEEPVSSTTDEEYEFLLSQMLTTTQKET